MKFLMVLLVSIATCTCPLCAMSVGTNQEPPPEIPTELVIQTSPTCETVADWGAQLPLCPDLVTIPGPEVGSICDDPNCFCGPACMQLDDGSLCYFVAVFCL